MTLDLWIVFLKQQNNFQFFSQVIFLNFFIIVLFWAVKRNFSFFFVIYVNTYPLFEQTCIFGFCCFES